MRDLDYSINRENKYVSKRKLISGNELEFLDTSIHLLQYILNKKFLINLNAQGKYMDEKNIK
jgi:hypothetical protein